MLCSRNFTHCLGLEPNQNSDRDLNPQSLSRRQLEPTVFSLKLLTRYQDLWKLMFVSSQKEFSVRQSFRQRVSLFAQDARE